MGLVIRRSQHFLLFKLLQHFCLHSILAGSTSVAWLCSESHVILRIRVQPRPAPMGDDGNVTGMRQRGCPQALSPGFFLFFPFHRCHHLSPPVDRPIRGPSAPGPDAEGSLLTFTRRSDEKKAVELPERCFSHLNTLTNSCRPASNADPNSASLELA